MQFLKTHYEKILLSLVLLGLAGAAVWLPFAIDQAKKDLAVLTNALPAKKQLKPLNLASNAAIIEKFANPATLDMGAPHLVFNPVIWKQNTADGRLIKIESSNPADALKVNKTTPLSLIIALERISVNGTNIGYMFAVTNQAAHKFPATKESFYCKLRDKNKYFTLKEVQGAPENPDALILELVDGKQQISVEKSKAFELLLGFAADLVYPIENKTFVDVRVGTPLTFGGDKYKVIAINANEVRVQADSNDKQTTIKLKTAQ
jgi:hypothetical protein